MWCWTGRSWPANPWEWDAEYDYAAAPWYTQARSAEGRVIFTDVYTDAVYGRPVVTAAQSCAQDGAVMAFDILPEHLSFEAAELKEEESFFLCDGKGTAVYQKTALELPQEEVQAYLTSLVERISSGELEGGGAVRDMDGAAGPSITRGSTTAGTPSSPCPMASSSASCGRWAGRCF